MSEQGDKILLIGFDAEMLELLGEVLTERDFSVFSMVYDHASRSDLQSCLMSLEPSICLIDEELPDLDGEELFDALKDTSRRDGFGAIPVVVLCDDARGERMARCLDIGIDDVLAKPYDVDELCARLRSTIRRRTEHSSLGAQDAGLAGAESSGVPETHKGWIQTALSGAELPPLQEDEHGPIGFAGQTQWMSLSDVFMVLSQNVLSGTLKVQLEDGTYTFDFYRGQFLHMQGPFESKGLKALYRAIRMGQGSFVFRPELRYDDDLVATMRQEADYPDVPSLLLAGAQEADEWPLTYKRLPTNSEVILGIAADKRQAATEHREVLKPLLDHPEREFSIDDLIYAAPHTDLQTAKQLLKLIREGILERLEVLSPVSDLS